MRLAHVLVLHFLVRAINLVLYGLSGVAGFAVGVTFAFQIVGDGDIADHLLDAAFEIIVLGSIPWPPHDESTSWSNAPHQIRDIPLGLSRRPQASSQDH